MQHVAFVEAATNGVAFVIAIGHLVGGKVRIDLDVREPPFAPQHVVRDFAVILRERGIKTAVGAKHSSRWTLTEFAKHNINYEFCKYERPDLHRMFLSLLDSGRVELPKHEGFRAQLRSLRNRQKDHGEYGDDILTAVAGVAVTLTVPAQTEESEHAA